MSHYCKFSLALITLSLTGCETFNREQAPKPSPSAKYAVQAQPLIAPPPVDLYQPSQMRPCGSDATKAPYLPSAHNKTLCPAPKADLPKQYKRLHSHAPRQVDVQQALAQAYRKSIHKPSANGFVNAIQFYDYMPGAIYEIWTAPGYLTTIALRPGEQVITKAAGDTVRYLVGETTTGTGPKSQTLVLIKPIRPDISTNLMISTSERVYYFDVKAKAGNAYNSAVAFNYPVVEFNKMQHAQQIQEQKSNDTIMQGVHLNNLDFDYKISQVKGRRTPAWMPIQAFNDSEKTYIQFPKGMQSSEAPPLFMITGEEKTVELVNYRVKGKYYVVDRLFDIAELRLGNEKPTIIRIERKS
jgi:P-type conjugative transfer protein TrbG